MEALEFKEIIKLINHTRTTFLNPSPINKSKGNWDLYAGEYKVHVSTVPFNVLYLHSDASTDSIKEARAKVFKPGETLVVYAPSLDLRRQTHHEILKPESDSRFWTTKEYLASFLRDELDAYRTQLAQLTPEYYTEPPVETASKTTRRYPNPLMLLLTDPETQHTKEFGDLGIVVAEPGQGKTYMAKHLVSELAGKRKKSDYFPVYVDSAQWSTLNASDLTSIWKTIAHSFRHFNAPISWIEGCEDLFIRTTLKAGLFRIVFDGFDEYILKNHGRIQAIDALQSLLALVKSTGARVVVTSRNTFWDSEIANTDAYSSVESEKCINFFSIKPFERNHAKNYFENRLAGQEEAIKSALQLFLDLRKHGETFVGRGFVLNLIADLVCRYPSIRFDESKQSPIQWLMRSICEREKLRQELPIDADQQLKILRTFVSDVAQNNPPNTETLEYAIGAVASTLDVETRTSCMSKMISHPIINKSGNEDSWTIPQEQIRIVLLTEQLISLTESAKHNELRTFSQHTDFSSSELNDLASMTVEISYIELSEKERVEKFKKTIASLLGEPKPLQHSPEHGNNIKQLAALIALKVVDKYVIKGSSRLERSDFFLAMLPNKTIESIPFSGTIASMDFCGKTFKTCRFDHVRWANCVFDKNTVYENCHFIGGSKSNCEGLGEAKWISPTSDEEGKLFISSCQIESGKKQYDENDLRSDITSVITRFIGKSGLGYKSITERNIKTGAIRMSKHADLIIDEVKKKILLEHHVSGSSEPAYKIADEAKNSVKFFADNNVFTGPLQEIFEKLKSKLNV